jgi:MoaA/NifB/PqqE/SkfB family radical SAM enzyme
LVVINEYLLSVARLGCKAIIITGGGEPTLYPAFKLILQTIKKLGMEYALITNGTTISQQNLFVYDFSWVRISVNNNPFWIKRFMENKHKFLKTTIVGLSFIYSGKNKEFKPADLLLFADHINAEYIRLLPDCMPENDKLEESYSELRSWLGKRHDKRFFIQEKKHLAPKSVICHQAYFRPYLSELNGGTVFPCDSIPLNSSTGQFNDKYALCKPEEIYKFLKKDIIQDFNCLIDCHGCVFTHNVDLLHDFMTDPEPKWITKEVKHKNFV